MTGADDYANTGQRIEQLLTKVLEMGSDFAPAYSLQGAYLWSSGQPGAEAKLKKALTLEPDNMEVLADNAYYYLRSGRPDLALPMQARVVELDPVAVNALFVLGRIQSALGQDEQALATYKKIREIDPVSPGGYSPVSAVMMANGEIVSAASIIQQLEQP